ncbi:MAG: SRPBCC domain-containing protein, partial [Chloroflexi bacterium]|nr:SRPBCC domain-containing protein [Chloroflexota bacterium]
MNDLARIDLCYSITFEREVRHSPSRLWSAISNAEEVSRWMGYPARIDLKAGGDYFVDFERSGEGGLDGIITRFENQRLLHYCWGLSTSCW